MDEAASIGATLKEERESRDLDLRQVREATKITTQNIEALEGDRFDAFPNKVYARAFLRDYANFLGLDSGSLLTRYEEEWGARREAEPVRPARSGNAWRALGYALVVTIVLAAVGAGSYVWWTGCERRSRAAQTAAGERRRAGEEKPIPSPQLPPVVVRPTQPPPPTPAVPEKITLDVTALRGVWVRVRCDGTRAYEAIMPKGASKRFEAKDAIDIRAGMAGAVRLKFNGQLQPPLGTLRTAGEKTFRRTPSASSPVKPVTSLEGEPRPSL